MRLCSYVVKHDTGFAPNPFWGYCTLVGCTPNHMRIKLIQGDWVIGNAETSKRNNLIYAMEVSEILHFNDYFSDNRFQKKKPILNGTWRQFCGDNIYYQENGKWKKIKTFYHKGRTHTEKDTKHPYVYISKHFYYFGENSIGIPSIYKDLLWDRHGVKCNHDHSVINRFISWLIRNYKSGINGKPRDSGISNVHKKIRNYD